MVLTLTAGIHERNCISDIRPACWPVCRAGYLGGLAILEDWLSWRAGYLRVLDSLVLGYLGMLGSIGVHTASSQQISYNYIHILTNLQ